MPLPMSPPTRQGRAGARAPAAALAVALAAAGAAQAQSVPMLTNDYNLIALMPPAEAWLDSYVVCGTVRCDIAYRIHTLSVDRYVQVAWKDTAGATLASGTNARLSNFYNPKDFGGYVEAVEWSKGGVGSAWFPTTPGQATGTADFTGTGAGADPCGIGYVCDDAEYYYWPKPASGPPRPIAPSHAAVQAPIAPGSITGTLSNVGVDLSAPEDVGDRRAEFISFTSSVEADGGLYRYSYSVTNLTGLSIPFEWAGAGLDGQLEPFAVARRDFRTAAVPRVVDSLPSWTLQTGGPYPLVASFANSLELLAPVPEPARWAQLAAGLAWLAGASLLRRRRRDGAAGPGVLPRPLPRRTP